MRTNSFSVCFLLFVYFVVPLFLNFHHVTSAVSIGGGEGHVPVKDGPAVRKDERTTLVTNEFGEISAVKISDSKNGFYYLHFITMNPRSLFLPTYLHSEMLFYVDSGNGTLSWMDAEKGDKLQQLPLQRGVIFRLEPETIFYIQNNAQSTGSGYSYDYESQILRIYAIFPGSETELQTKQQFSEPYTGVHDLVLGFDDNVLQATFGGIPLGVIEDLRGAERQPLIVEGQPAAEDASMWGAGPLGPWANRAFLGIKNNDLFNIENKNKAYDIYKEGRDIKTLFGWSATVTGKELAALKHTDFGVFMVNLTTGSMMGPHWNLRNDEVAIVLNGQGMVEVVCPGVASETGCQNSRFRVEEGDVFVVPSSIPMAQISFNNDYFVFLGFRKMLKDDIPQTLKEKLSILQKLDKTVLEKSFNVKNTTLDWVFSAKKDSYIYECISCAEEAEAGSESKERGGGQEWPQKKGKEGEGGRQEEEETAAQGWPQEKERGWPQKKRKEGQGGRQEEEKTAAEASPREEEGGSSQRGSQERQAGSEKSKEGKRGGPAGGWQEEQGGGSPKESQEGQGQGGSGGWQWGPGGAKIPKRDVA